MISDFSLKKYIKNKTREAGIFVVNQLFKGSNPLGRHYLH
jgi:hypothetical protein